jgi:hypothetical protein
MIAKIEEGNNLYGALTYNQLKVEKDNGQFCTSKDNSNPDGSYATNCYVLSDRTCWQSKRLKNRYYIYLSILIQG